MSTTTMSTSSSSSSTSSSDVSNNNNDCFGTAISPSHGDYYYGRIDNEGDRAEKLTQSPSVKKTKSTKVVQQRQEKHVSASSLWITKLSDVVPRSNALDRRRPRGGVLGEHGPLPTAPLANAPPPPPSDDNGVEDANSSHKVAGTGTEERGNSNKRCKSSPKDEADEKYSSGGGGVDDDDDNGDDIEGLKDGTTVRTPPRSNVVWNHMSMSAGNGGSSQYSDDSERSDELTPLVVPNGDHRCYNGGSNDLAVGTCPSATTRTTSVSTTVSTATSTSASKTSHAQALLLGLAFAAVWSPQNLMAPNLTQMAEFYNFDNNQRDVFLGANIALATGVLSLPLSGLIGFLGDVVSSRRNLYALTVAVGGASCICGGASATYKALYVSRFVCGGCMAGTVPVAFSLLGDMFCASERNAASSGLTTCMGGGMILGQLFAGYVGAAHGWQYPFYTCGAITIVLAFMVSIFVQEPERGGKEEALQAMIRRGRSYDRKLTWKDFVRAMRKNTSNFVLIWQGFFTSVPWGIIMTFLNDYLSQECGLSVPDATFLVLLFGVGAGVGGILGGWAGQVTTRIHPGYMPIFMAVSTFCGMLPFVGLLNSTFDHAGLLPCFYSFSGGLIANLPSVNVRPALINVNPPETRGATLTAANLVINLARGTGPMMLTSLGGVFDISRQMSFNILLIVFWSITAILLLCLSRTLPIDQDKVAKDLARYVAGEGDEVDGEDGIRELITADTPESVGNGRRKYYHHHHHARVRNDSRGMCRRTVFGSSSSGSCGGSANATTSCPAGMNGVVPRSRRNMMSTMVHNSGGFEVGLNAAGDDGTVCSIVSIEERMTSFDNEAAMESLCFFEEAIREIGGELQKKNDPAANATVTTTTTAASMTSPGPCTPRGVFRRKHIATWSEEKNEDDEEHDGGGLVAATEDTVSSPVSSPRAANSDAVSCFGPNDSMISSLGEAEGDVTDCAENITNNSGEDNSIIKGQDFDLGRDIHL